MSNIIEVELPDVGGEKVDVIDICVENGDIVVEDAALITVETEKASMDIPAIQTGKILEIKVKLGDKIEQGNLICTMIIEKENIVNQKNETKIVEDVKNNEEPILQVIEETIEKTKLPTQITNNVSVSSAVYSSPSIRKLAREFGVNLSLVKASGRKNRIILDDVKLFIKESLENNTSNVSNDLGFNLPKNKEIDFSKFGEVVVKPLSKIQKISGPTLHKNWISIPHITQFDEADITSLEEFRKVQNENALKLQNGIKISPLIFVIKAVARALEIHKNFNSSLSNDGSELILKKYIHIGVAVDTKNGLVVPVIKNANKKGINELSMELSQLSNKAREGKLTIQDMQGGCFTISSLGGIGGTSFTPIINSPEVAILGLSKSEVKAKYNGKEFLPRLMLPLSLSYDHRVIDGAEGARFSNTLVKILSDIRQLIL
jgi:pyruvate dehydrogenase E2 component (dihydrolipoamide acetyltransferase)